MNGSTRFPLSLPILLRNYSQANGLGSSTHVSHLCVTTCIQNYTTFYVPINSCVLRVGLELVIRTTAGQEDPFELDSNLLLSVDQHGEDRKRQSTPCVRPWNTATWRFGWLTVLALPSFTSISNNTRALLQSAVSVTCINPLSDLILFWVLPLEELFDHDASWGLATSVVST